MPHAIWYSSRYIPRPSQPAVEDGSVTTIFPSPTVGLAWKTKSSEFHNQVMKITSDFHAKYPEVEESLLFAYAENKFQTVVGYVFGRMQENGRKNLP